MPVKITVILKLRIYRGALKGTLRLNLYSINNEKITVTRFSTF